MSDTLNFDGDVLPEDLQDLQARLAAEGARFRQQLPPTERLARTAHELLATQASSKTLGPQSNHTFAKRIAPRSDNLTARWRTGGFAAALAVVVVFVVVFKLFGQTGIPAQSTNLLLVNNSSGTLLALQPNTGTHVWSFHTKDWWMSDAVTTRGMTILYALGPADSSGVITTSLFALDSATGTLRWRYPAVNIHMHEVTRPTVVQDTVYLVGGDNVHSSVLALDLHTGQTRWQTPEIGVNTERTLAVGAGMVYAGGQGIDALRTSDGHVMWHDNLPGTGHSSVGSISLTGDRLVVATIHDTHTILDLNHPDFPYDADQLFGLQPGNGSLIWHFSAPNCNYVDADPVVDPDIAYISTYTDCTRGKDQTTIFALRMNDGAQLWNYPGRISAHDAQALYALNGYTDEIYALARLTGQELWHRQPGERSLISGNHNLLSVSLFSKDSHNMGTIESLDEQGHLRWQIPIADTNGIDISPSSDILYTNVNQEDGTTGLYAFRASDGHVLWRQPGIRPLNMGYIIAP